ncbi:MAG: lytic murein transglycosylase [Candidatus Pacebacteria bacterium]|nr:lytic murein transglycosylase [Candidatus Paceibacterota bacterium]
MSLLKKLAPYLIIVLVAIGSYGASNVLASPTNTSETCVYGSGANPDDPNTASNKPCTQPYKLLAPLGETKTVPVGETNALGGYINTIITLVIGIAAVLAMVMIVMGGIEYMTSELISSKEAGKQRINNAILGLLIALGAWLILYTINPDLLNTNVGIPSTTIEYIVNFEISGAQSRSTGGAPSKINFNSQALPAAQAAAAKTGVDAALILAIFSQESGGGRNTGGCLANDPRAKMKDEDKVALQKIVGGSIDNINVSCAASVGYGGAIGLTQFLPTTWLRFKDTAAGYLGHQPDPWNVNDALMVTAIYLKVLGGVDSPYNAACGYFGKCSSGGIDYAAQVVSKMDKIKQQIAEGSGFKGAGGGKSF